MLACTVPNIELQPVLDAFAARRLVLIPYFLALLLVSPATLKYWLAVRRAHDVPAAPVATVDQPKATRLSLTKFALSFIAGVLLCSAPFWLPIGWSELFVLLVTTILPFVCMLVMNVGIASRHLKLGVFRNPAGAPVTVQIPIERTRLRNVLFSAQMLAPFVIAGLIPRDVEVACIIAATAISFVGIQNWTTNFSFRRYSMVAAAYAGVCFVVAAILVSRKKDWEGIKTAQMDAGEEANSLMAWFLPAFLAYASGALVAGSLRFDYQNYADSLPEGPEVFSPLEVVPRPEPRVHEGRTVERYYSGVIGETGVVIPTSLPSFKPIYFCVAFMLSAVVSGGLTLLEVYTVIAFKDNNQYAFCAFFVASPVICVGLCIVAALRGESKKLWTYKEEWNLSAKPAAKPVSEATTSESVLGEKVEEKVEILVEV